MRADRLLRPVQVEQPGACRAQSVSDGLGDQGHQRQTERRMRSALVADRRGIELPGGDGTPGLRPEMILARGQSHDQPRR